MPAPLSAIGALVRRADPDRFFTALFAPAARREALFTLYAFNNELARAREAASTPMLALIRLQWWREVVEGAVRQHEVATPLSALLAEGALDPAELGAIVDAREAEVDTIDTMEEWRATLLAGPGGLAMAAARLLGAPCHAAFRPLGAVYGAAGMVRNVAPLARSGRCLLPADTLAAHGLSPEAVIADPASPALRPVFDALAAQVRPWLGAGPVPRGALAAALPAVLARRDLRHASTGGPRGLGDRLAVTMAAATGRL